MPRSSLSFTARTAGVVVAALAAWMPQQASAQPSAFRTPQFKATAVSFKALHETHWNWLGSDEVRAVFYDFTAARSDGTSVFGDVDAGETRNIAPEQSCISLQPTCARGASSLGFGLMLLEVDDWVGGFFDPVYCHGSLDPSGPPPTPAEFEAQFDNYRGDTCYGDDFIGRAKVKLSQADLVAMLPTVGAFVDATVPLTGGAGRYEFTYRITRLPNAINIPPIGPPVMAYQISLQASVVNNANAKRVDLTWSGATTATVDIYRDGAKIVTTANDGTYSDPVASGTYQYRVCELGSTATCSDQVTAVVP